ncbi:hypothetical protein [Chryseobacterium indoltheticum]|uniref:hypothetical protein n=1 Tax=Chryseobacterium indoltheticum TaxID=254 RepID=UPI003F4937A0
MNETENFNCEKFKLDLIKEILKFDCEKIQDMQEFFKPDIFLIKNLQNRKLPVCLIKPKKF